MRTDYKFNGGGDPGYDTRLGVETEIGLMVKMWESGDKTSKLSLRPELKMRWADPGNANLKDYLYMVGVQYSFGGSPVAAPMPVAADAAAAPAAAATATATAASRRHPPRRRHPRSRPPRHPSRSRA